MTKPICRACGAESGDAFLCDPCTNRAELAIAMLPNEIHDLELALSRQTKIDATPTNRPAEPVPYGPAGPVLPAFLRSAQGQITLPQTQNVVSLGAAQLHTEAVNAVGTWVRHLLEANNAYLPYDGPAGPWHAQCDHGSCGTIRRHRYHWPVERLCIWLMRNIDVLRQNPAAGEIVRKILTLRSHIAKTVDRHDPDIYAGTCDAKDVRIGHRPLIGAPCAPFECSHDSCRRIRAHDNRIVTWLSKCGADLYANFGDTEVKCEVCGIVYDAVDRKKYLLDHVDDEWRRPHVIANALTGLGEPINPTTLRKWIERDEKLAQHLAGRVAPYPLVLQRGIDDDGKPVFRVGDVRARIAVMRSRRQQLPTAG